MFNSVGEIMAANAAIGGHYFDEDTLRWFNDRVLGDLYGGRYFITSEQNHGSGGPYPRLYSVQEAAPNGSIKNASEFQAFSTAAQAKSFARRLAEADLPFSEYDTVQIDVPCVSTTTGDVLPRGTAGRVSHYTEIAGVLIVVVNMGAGKDWGPVNVIPDAATITEKHGG